MHYIANEYVNVIYNRWENTFILNCRECAQTYLVYHVAERSNNWSICELKIIIYPACSIASDQEALYWY